MALSLCCFFEVLVAFEVLLGFSWLNFAWLNFTWLNFAELHSGLGFNRWDSMIVASFRIRRGSLLGLRAFHCKPSIRRATES